MGDVARKYFGHCTVGKTSKMFAISRKLESDDVICICILRGSTHY